MHVARVGEMQHAEDSLVGKHVEENISLDTEHRWENNIKIDVKIIWHECG
jgi:hypothetical protein